MVVRKEGSKDWKEQNYELGADERILRRSGKPISPIIGANGNIFNLMNIATKTLKEHNKENEAKEMFNRIIRSNNYMEALIILEDYIDFGMAEDKIGGDD